ncbi:MAG: hypothetical protein RLZZ195_917 [Pseudomonadota bacterium]|jgi:hypothetical protein
MSENLDGFNNTKPAGTTPWPAASQSPASGGSFGAGLSWPAAEDKSTQDSSGVGQGGK